jgi:hypothetical protein
MSADVYRTVTHQSFGSRIGNSFKGIIIGLILFLGSFLLLFWNEGRTVKRHRTLLEGAAAVVPVQASAIDPANDNKLIHLSGRADTESILSDPMFGVSTNALRLKRVVEMYQWEEKKKTETRTRMGGGEETITTYTYNEVWSDDLIKSDRFQHPGHDNPSTKPFPSESWDASPILLGAFQLSASLTHMLDNFVPVAAPTNSPVKGAGLNIVPTDSGFYMGKDPAQPQIKDVRVSFKAVYPQDISVIAKQTGSSFSLYITKAGGEIELLEPGIVTAGIMFQNAKNANRMLAWILRLGGFLFMFIGLSIMLKPLSVVASVLPILGRLVALGTGLVAFAAAAVLSLTTIAIAWFVYRPLLGGALLVVAAALIFMIVQKLKKISP